MKLHEIIESDGFKRQIVDFDSEGRPVTKPYNGEEPPTEEVTEEPTEETPTEETAEFKCQYCRKVCKSELGLLSHEKACKENPNK